MRYHIPAHVRGVHNDGAVLLLNVHSGAYFALNPVGSLVWEHLSAGGTREDALAGLRQRFRAPPERLARDVDALLERLVAKGLLAQGGLAPDPSPAALEPVPVLAPEAPPRSQAPARLTPAWRVAAVLLSYALLVCMDLLLRLRGFERFHETMRRWPVRARRASDVNVAGLCAAVDSAAGYYFKRAWCLQRSAATVALLRGRGLPAQLVIGVRRLPFMAHAWVELDGRIVNDDPRLRRTLEVIERT